MRTVDYKLAFLQWITQGTLLGFFSLAVTSLLVTGPARGDQMGPNDFENMRRVLQQSGFSDDQIGQVFNSGGTDPGTGSGSDGGSDVGGGRGGGSGARLAQIMQAAAALTQSAQPSVIAAVEAAANKDIAKINANAQIDMTGIVANTTKFDALMQSQTSVGQALIERDIAKNAQQETTLRTALQTNAYLAALEDRNRQEDKRMSLDASVQAQEIALGKAQFDASYQLSLLQIRAQVTAAGLKGDGTDRASVTVRPKSFSSGRALASNLTNSQTRLILSGRTSSRPPATQSGVGVISRALNGLLDKNVASGSTVANRFNLTRNGNGRFASSLDPKFFEVPASTKDSAVPVVPAGGKRHTRGKMLETSGYAE